jgi:hypothetical protein
VRRGLESRSGGRGFSRVPEVAASKELLAGEKTKEEGRE